MNSGRTVFGFAKIKRDPMLVESSHQQRLSAGSSCSTSDSTTIRASLFGGPEQSQAPHSCWLTFLDSPRVQAERSLWASALCTMTQGHSLGVRRPAAEGSTLAEAF